MPRIEILNEDGEVVHCLAPEKFKPLKLPSLQSIPKNRTGRTSAHFLGTFDYNVDTALDYINQDQSRQRLGKVA
jgi:hypothetical protein